MGTVVALVPQAGPGPSREAIAHALAEFSRRRREAGPLTRLTPRQREIALLAAAGLDNAAIARRLWVTRRTVEFHLTNVYRELGVDGRGRLAGVVGVPPSV